MGRDFFRPPPHLALPRPGGAGLLHPLPPSWPVKQKMSHREIFVIFTMEHSISFLDVSAPAEQASFFDAVSPAPARLPAAYQPPAPA